MVNYRLTGLKVIFFLCLCFAVAGCSKQEWGAQEGTVSPGADPSPTEVISPTPTKEAAPTNGGESSADGKDVEDPIISGTANEILLYFQEKTLRYAYAMLSGEFAVCKDFSPELSDALSERDMKAAFKQAVTGLGEPLDVDGEEAGESGQAALYAEASFLTPPSSLDMYGSIEDFGGYVVTSAQIPYKSKTLILSVTYGAVGTVEGIYLTYTLPEAKPERTEEFTEYEVWIGGDGHPLSGMLTLPNGVEHPPVVLFVHGSGQSDMNETTGAAGNAPFEDLAHGLAKQGIASLRYNKRYYQYPELAAEDITIKDEVLNDVADAIGFLAAREDVDSGRIYVLGHSLGGMLAPYIAQKNPQVAGIISLAGSPRGLWEIVYDQNIAAIGMAELGGQEAEGLKQMVQEEYEKVLSLVADVRGGGTPEKETLSQALFGVSGHYWASLAEIDTALIAQKLDVPMLILQGGADFQVYPDRDYAAWQALLEGKEKVTFQLFEGLNHLFMPSGGVMDVTEYDVEAHIPQEVIGTVAKWIYGLGADGE
ncbi:MAG: lysophospholipase [Lachnospiraceae bacterium]|nr:lysophospholipase [Lachnospiraceae bacterium]